MRYAAAVERAYTAALSADPAYTGRFQHNPPLRRVRHEDRAGRTVFARRARTLRRPQRTRTQEEPADRNRPQRRDLRSSAALGIRRRRRLADRHVRGVVRRGRRSRRPDRGRRRRREPARSAQGQRGRSHRQERGALGLGALWRGRPAAPTRSPDRGATRAREGPSEGPGSGPGAFAYERAAMNTPPRRANVAQRPRKCGVPASRCARSRRRSSARLPRFIDC